MNTLKKVLLINSFIAASSLMVAGQAGAQTYSVLQNFGDYDEFYEGLIPRAPLISLAGEFFGTTFTGGEYSGDEGGVVYELDSSGLSYLHDFSSLSEDGTNSDGYNPSAGLVVSGSTFYGTAEYGGIGGTGTVFSVSEDGSGFTTLLSFDALTSELVNSDGAFPVGSLVLSESGTLYGTTRFGGAYDYGTVFKINTDGSGFGVLYTFTGGSDGGAPLAGLILNGNVLYGTASCGGAGVNGTVFSINTDGTGFTTLYNFTGGGDGSTPLASLLLAGNTLFGTTEYGGDYEYPYGTFGTIFAINTDGSDFTTLYRFTDGSDGANPMCGLVTWAGTLYGTTQYGGYFYDEYSIGEGTVFAINMDGSDFTTLHTFTGFTYDDGSSPVASLLLAGGTLYGTTSFGGSLVYGTVFSLSGELPPPAEFVAISGDDNSAAYSYDGVTWHASPTGLSGMSAVCYGGGLFVAVGGGSSAAYSLDGATWNASILPAWDDWVSVAYAPGVFVAIAEDSEAAYSGDGSNWFSLPGGLYSEEGFGLNLVAYGGDYVVAIPTDNCPNSAFMGASFAFGWSPSTTGPCGAFFNGLTYGNGEFVAVGYGDVASYSADGIYWNGSSMPSYDYWTSVAYGNGIFVAVSGWDNSEAYSTDGVTWYGTTMPNSDYLSVTFGDGKFVAVGAGGFADYSTDGVDWSSSYLPSSDEWVGVAGAP